MDITEIQAVYAKYEQAWQVYVDAVNGNRFCGGMFPARFTQADKREFIKTLALIDLEVCMATSAMKP